MIPLSLSASLFISLSPSPSPSLSPSTPPLPDSLPSPCPPSPPPLFLKSPSPPPSRRQQRFALVKKEGRWPPAGPDFGGSTVLFYPQTGAAKREGVMCQFGASVLSGGYDAFNGVVACSPPPWVHIVQEGETLSSIAQR